MISEIIAKLVLLGSNAINFEKKSCLNYLRLPCCDKLPFPLLLIINCQVSCVFSFPFFFFKECFSLSSTQKRQIINGFFLPAMPRGKQWKDT